MIIAIPVTPEGNVDPRWGKAHDVAIAQVEGSEIVSWTVHEVNWDELHDLGAHGTHHGRIVRFLKEQGVGTVVINHAGPPMMNTMDKMGLNIAINSQGPAKAAALQAAAHWEA